MKIIIAILSGLIVLFLGYFMYLYNNLHQKSELTELSDKVNSNSKPTMNNIRRPAVAGSFYPADKNKLSNDIDDYLSKVKLGSKSTERKGQLKMVLVPHAGYEYSGPVAAYGYKMIENFVAKQTKDYQPTVVILASSHDYPISNAVADSVNSWETPLGQVDLDQDFIDKLGIQKDDSPFVPEHSLEVQLPFLQKVLPNGFKLVPILVGNENRNEAEKFASRLAELINENTLVIISSDMSHYPSYEDAAKADAKTIESILTGDVDKFDNTIAELEKEDIPNAATFMCAKPAVELGLLLAKNIGIKNIKLLEQSNSGDVTGDKSRVVGYSAIGFFGDSESKNYSRQNKEVSSKEEENQIILKIARDSVESFIKNGSVPNFEALVKDSIILNQKSGAFVTLNMNSQLRGCIGLMESDQPLYKTISQMAVAAATQDNRFYPVSAEELSKIKYEVSVLSPMKQIKKADEIKLGAHGVKVEKDGRSGVFLPQVAEETGWELEEFMNHLCQEKAGLSMDCWKDPATKIYIFTAQIFSDE